VIARLAISPDAVRSLSASGSPAEVFGRHAALLEALEAHGFLVFGTVEERQDIQRAIKEAGPETERLWRQLMTRFFRSGRFMDLDPPSACGLDELTDITGLRAAWAPDTDVAVVSEARAEIFEIPPGDMLVTDAISGIESVLAPAASHAGTLARYKATRNRQVIATGGSRDDLWREAIRPIARVAASVNIVDRYLFEHLADLDAGRRGGDSFVAWVLDRLDREARSGCHVTLIGYDARPHGSPVDADAAAALVGSVFTAAGDRVSTIEVVTAQPASYLPHDRHISTNLNVGLTFLESFDSLDRDLITSPEGIEYSYRFDPEAIDKLQTSERRFGEDRSARRVVAFAR
jgi:hypothetical protein